MQNASVRMRAGRMSSSDKASGSRTASTGTASVLAPCCRYNVRTRPVGDASRSPAPSSAARSATAIARPRHAATPGNAGVAVGNAIQVSGPPISLTTAMSTATHVDSMVIGT